MLDILAHVRAAVAAGSPIVELDVLDPDAAPGRYAGEHVTVGGQTYVHRPYRVWLDLAERLALRFLTPRPGVPPLVTVRFAPLDGSARPGAGGDPEPGEERYGVGSAFQRIAKPEDPGFVLDLADALARCTLAPGARVLELGVNRGDVLGLVRAVAPELAEANLVGVDHSESAIAVARDRFPRARFHIADLHALPALGFGRFDLVISMSTLHSPDIDDREVLRRVVQDHLAPRGSVIFGFPNCRYLDGEVEYGTRMKNFRQPELGLLIKDVAFYRKYLQQHHRQVFVTGKHEVLVTGVPIAERQK
jgi:2-polyprenyl-3-methyl-5-hydroxy-6-metoxy-1,4-benzoquinol methylase